MFVYSAKVWEGEDGWYADFPAFGGNCFTDGDSYSDVIEAAAETLRLVIATYISEEGLTLPDEDLSQKLGDVVFAVDVDDDFVLRTSCVTVGEAAKELGVSHSRVCQMLNSGLLESVKYGNGRLVTMKSINEYEKTPRKAGRPKVKK